MENIEFVIREIKNTLENLANIVEALTLKAQDLRLSISGSEKDIIYLRENVLDKILSLEERVKELSSLIIDNPRESIFLKISDIKKDIISCNEKILSIQKQILSDKEANRWRIERVLSVIAILVSGITLLAKSLGFF